MSFTVANRLFLMTSWVRLETSMPKIWTEHNGITGKLSKLVAEKR